MLFTTLPQFVVLALVLFAGFLFGLAAHPGGRKWRTRYEAERDAHNGYRTAADKRVTETEARARAAESRADEAERRLAAARTTGAATTPPVAEVPRAHQPYVADPAVARPDEKPVFISDRAAPVTAQSAAQPAYGTTRRGWFDWR